MQARDGGPGPRCPLVPARSAPRRAAPLALLLALSLLSAGAARGQDPPAAAEERFHLQMRRAETPPDIDGRLDDPVWQDAPFFRGLTQVEPLEGVPATEDTVIKLLYDRHYLYLGIRCFDSEPDRILASQLVRDELMYSDDNFSIMIDTFLDERNGYHFALNALGNKVDGLIENTAWKGEWDGIWYAETSIDSQGWVAEIAIPFKTLSFDPNGTRWGFNFAREIRRKNEMARLARADRSRGNTDMSGVAVLEGIRDIEQGIGLDVKPSLSLRYEEEDDDRDFDPEPSLDVFYKITPSLTGVLTANTDFAETEVDERQVNLTRFSIFFPEKRDFFLQDAGIFDFAGRDEGNALPYFSRRIGIAPDGEEVRIWGGAKLTGRVGPVNLGVLDVQMDSHDEIDSTNLSVARVALNVLQESTLGLIATNGDPASNDNNTLIGSDFNYRNTRVFGDQLLTANLWFQNTFSTGKHDHESAFGGKLAYPNDRINFALEAQSIQENYRPALGFANRLGIRQYDGDFRYRFRPGGYLRTVDLALDTALVTDPSDDLESGRLGVTLVELANQLGDSLGFHYILSEERLDQPTRIAEGVDVLVAEGDYTFSRGRITLATTDIRPVNGSISLEWGPFYSGRRFEVAGSLDWRPSPHAFLSIQYEQNDVDLEEGDFITRLLRARVNVIFTPYLSWNTFLQYDNVSDLLGINSRIRWIVDPGNEIFLVFNQGWAVDDTDFQALRSELTFKVGWTFRF